MIRNYSLDHKIQEFQLCLTHHIIISLILDQNQTNLESSHACTEVMQRKVPSWCWQCWHHLGSTVATVARPWSSHAATQANPRAPARPREPPTQPTVPPLPTTPPSQLQCDRDTSDSLKLKPSRETFSFLNPSKQPETQKAGDLPFSRLAHFRSFPHSIPYDFIFNPSRSAGVGIFHLLQLYHESPRHGRIRLTLTMHGAFSVAEG